MTNLFIETDENGNCVNHPAFEDNLIQAFGCIPAKWKPFVRVERPVIGIYEIFYANNPTYEFINGTWMDVWHFRSMTNDEKLEKQNLVKNNWANIPFAANFSNWVFDEESCSMNPPILRPNDGKQWRWCGAENSWKLAPDYPTDGKQYIFDFFQWAWVEQQAPLT